LEKQRKAYEARHTHATKATRLGYGLGGLLFTLGRAGGAGQALVESKTDRQARQERQTTATPSRYRKQGNKARKEKGNTKDKERQGRPRPNH